jgi:hypothetical protein
MAELLSSPSSRIGAGLVLGPASSGPGRALELVGRPLSPESEWERLFLKIDLMFMPLEPEAVGSSLLIGSIGGWKL